MVPDWKALLPHRPLDADTDQYVSPPAGGGEHIAEWILADRNTVLVAGPVGIGKSTELARAAKLLQADRFACLVRLDRFENMKRVTVDQILLRIAGQLALMALEEQHLSLSWELRAALSNAKVLAESRAIVDRAIADFTKRRPLEASAGSLLAITLSEVSRSSPQRRVTLLLDGLEKMPEGTALSEVFEALGMLADAVDIVAVLPWFNAFGAGPDTILRPGEHLVALRAPDVDDEPGQAGRTFLRELLARRLGLPPLAFSRSLLPLNVGVPTDRLHVFDRATSYSGGVPRTFLQLVADAGTYARMRRKDSWPQMDDLADAVADQEDSFRRLLRKGDTDAIRAVAGHDGRELELERKIRLLSHGVLLERLRGGTSVLTVHPLVEPLLNPGVKRA